MRDWTTHIPGLLKEKQPWYHAWKNARRRCKSTHPKIAKYYRDRGIKVFFTLEEVGELYLRDNASSMEHPQLHRRDIFGDYTYENCCFIERVLHTKLHHKGRKYSEVTKRRMSRARHAFGESHGRAKLTVAAVRRIWFDRSYGSAIKIMNEFNVNRTTICRIRSGKLWKKTVQSFT